MKPKFHAVVIILSNLAFGLCSCSHLCHTTDKSDTSPQSPVIAIGSTKQIGSAKAKLVHIFPKKHYFDNIAWLAKPIPNAAGLPYLITYSEFNGETGAKRNYIVDLASGKQLALPKPGGPMATPDGKFLIIPAFSRDGNGISFYPANEFVKSFEDSGKTGKSVTSDPAQIKPHFSDPSAGGFYQSVGIIQTGERKDNRTTYRLLHSRGEPFRITDYHVTYSDHGIGFEIGQSDALCDNLGAHQDESIAMLSKDGNHVALYDGSANATKIYEIILTNGKYRCTEVLSLGMPTGRVDFSFDNNKLAFHASFLTSGPESHKKEVVVAKLVKKDGKITGLKSLTRQSVDTASGSAYFPIFLANDELFYIHQGSDAANLDTNKAESGFRFEVIRPAHN